MPDFIPQESKTPNASVITDPVIVPPPIPPVLPGKKLPLLLLILIPILAITAVISIYVMLQARDMYQEATSTPTPSPSPVASADTTADWQTYSNEKMKLSLKYPSDANLKVFTSESNDLNFAINRAQYDPLFFAVAYLPTSELQDWYLKAYSSTRQDTQTAPELQKGLDIDGHASYYSDFNLEVVGKVRYIFIQTDKGIYQILMPLSSNTVQYQILSTFKIESAPKNEDLENVIMDLVYDYGKSHGITSKDQIIIKIHKIDGDYAYGTTSFDESVEEPGNAWYATYLDGHWTQIWAGQEPPACDSLSQWQYPTDFFECTK